MKEKSIGKCFFAFFLAVLLFSGSIGLEVAGKETMVTEEKEESIYYQWETLEEILELCEEGLDLQEFFRYTIWDSLTKEDIEALVESGQTLEKLYTQLPTTFDVRGTKVVGFSGQVSSALGSIPALGEGSHGPILKPHLSGETAFCAKFGAACRTGMVYTSVLPEDIGITQKELFVVKGLLAQYAEAQSVYTGPVNYIMTQAGIWLVQNDAWTGDAEGMAQSIEALFSKTPDCPSVDFAADYFRAVVNWLELPENAEKIEATEVYAWANGPNQYLITYGEDGGEPGEGSHYGRIELEKRDAETGKVIVEDAIFTIYEWKGSRYEKSDARILREGGKYYSDDLFYTVQNQGKFRLEETKAPADGTRTGYYGDFDGAGKRMHEIQLEESQSSKMLVLTNQRVTGSIRVYKKDIEADAYIAGNNSHGIAELDGAVYDLYAKEDIVHPDGVTGILYKKDSLVESGTIEKGTCVFEKLYLGSYYIKERQKGSTLPDGKKLSYAPGYLLDEVIYEVVLPYEGEGTANVHRDVTSNREQVIKARGVWEKVESAAGQGNISYLKGAGFTVYRIDKLSRRECFRRNPDGTYVEASIQEAYLTEGYNQDIPKYDFSGEEEAIATVYLRDTDMRADTAYYWQEGQAELKKGKLLSLGNNRYRVAELFSDENGQVVTPYLPYGQYLVVETSVPKDHFMAPPFVLTFAEGKTTKILTAGVTEQTPYGNNLLKSAGETVFPYEAVYFSKVIDNEQVEELLKIYKKDADTGKTVLLSDTAFRIARIEEKTGEKTYLTHTTYYPETVNRDVFRTNAQGYLQLPELLPTGLYQIEEVDGPKGFYNEIPGGYVRFRVTTERKYESLLGSPEGSALEGDLGKRDILCIVEEYRNRETRGVLSLQKRGQVLTEYKQISLWERVKGWLGLESEKQFLYEEQPLVGAEYTIRAAEDIQTQDRQRDPYGNRTLWFSKGEIVAVVTTGEEGQTDCTQAATPDYPEGHPIVTVLHDGLGGVNVYLPLGAYEIEETKAPHGYTRTKEICRAEFTWENQFEEFVYNKADSGEAEEVTVEKGTGKVIFANRRIKAVPEKGCETPGIGIQKNAKENGQPLAGVSFGLYTRDPIYNREGILLAEAGELLDVCRTDAAGNGVFEQDVPIQEEDYELGKGKNSGRYEIRELETPSGILLDAEPILLEFSGEDDQKEFVVLQARKENESSEVWISKQDLTNGKALAGAQLQIKADWNQEIVHTWISGEGPKEIRGLEVNESFENPVYTYTLTENVAPQGYRKAESMVFQLVKKDTGGKTLGNDVYVYDNAVQQWLLLEEKCIVMQDEPETSPGGKPGGGMPSPPVETVLAPFTGDSSGLGFYGILTMISVCGVFISLYGKYRRK